ncbi:MAG: response regulator [Pseudomonadales bacterium]|nr:response regulator [Pseudomonadales bacterium]
MTNDTAKQTVYIVDDDEAVRDSLEMLMKSVGLNAKSFESAIEFLSDIDVDASGCLVLDIRMPLMSGLELQDELISRGSILPIVFISGHGDIPMAVKAVKKGAIDFISKPFHDQELLDSVQRALREGDDLRGSQIAKKEITDNLEKLSPREKQVLDLMVDGAANKVIASELEISQRTVEVHRASVMDKMNANSLAQLVKFVASLGN